MDYVQHPERRALEVYGDRKTLDLDLETDSLRIYDCEQDGYRTMQYESERNNQFRMEHQDMIDAVVKGTPPRASGEDGIKALEIAEKAITQIRGIG